MSTAWQAVFWTTTVACLSPSAAIRQAAPSSGKHPDVQDGAAECFSDADCEGFQGECKDGECWYTAHELHHKDKEWPECIAGCSNFFDDFFQAPEAGGNYSCEGFVCRFWKNLFERILSQGGSGAPEAEWRSLLQDLGALDRAVVGAVPGLSPDSTATVMDCYCSRLCEMGSAANLGNDAHFWHGLLDTGASVDLTRLSVMDLVHAGFQENACDGVQAISLTGVVAVGTIAGISGTSEGASFVQSATVNSSSPTSLQELDRFNPLDCLKKLGFFLRRAAPDASKELAIAAAPNVATVAHDAAKAAGRGSSPRKFLALFNRAERRAADAVKRVPLMGNRASKVLKDFGRNRVENAADAFGNAFAAATVVGRIAAGDAVGGAADAAVLGVTHLAGGSLGGAVGLTGSAAIVFGAVCGIGISVTVSAGATLLAGGAAETAAAAGASTGVMGILRQGCK